jgi:hypothetical protein
VGEQVLVRRVVLVHQELVREVEADAAERVAVARRLPDAYGAVGILLDLSPIRSIACGSCCSAGRYSFWMIDGGTFQVGLTVMNFISAVVIGVGRLGLPTTILVFQTSLLSRTPGA